jgi:hypothetical protein
MDTTLLICTLTLESLETDTVAIRSLIYPEKDIVDEYYRTIIGVKEVEIESISVPSTFHVELIGTIGDPEITYPAYDIALQKSNLASYRSLIQRAIDDERARLVLGVKNAVHSTRSDNTVELPGYKQELFTSLHHVASVLETALSGGKPPDIVGWMVSPCHIPTREARGIKLFTDPSIGLTWDSLLGTVEFPDFIISKRITSASWTFQHPSTTKMLSAIMEWWATAHMRTEDYWIHSSETDLDEVLRLFRLKGVPTIYHSERMDPVKMALLEIEETILGNSEIYSPMELVKFSSTHTWKSWINCCLRSKGVMLDSNVTFLDGMIDRWMRDGWGIRTTCLPYPSPPPLRGAWTTLHRTQSINEESLLIWIRLLNINDPIYTIRVNHEQKQQILEDWIPVAAHCLKAANPATRAKSNPTYAWIRSWILQYVPVSLFKTFMLPKRMYPAVLAAGYPMIHSTAGYFFVGIDLPETTQDLTAWSNQEEID